MSIHPTMTNAKVEFIMDAIAQTATHVYEWKKEYLYNPQTNEFSFEGLIDKSNQDKIEESFECYSSKAAGSKLV